MRNSHVKFPLRNPDMPSAHGGLWGCQARLNLRRWFSQSFALAARHAKRSAHLTPAILTHELLHTLLPDRLEFRIIRLTNVGRRSCGETCELTAPCRQGALALAIRHDMPRHYHDTFASETDSPHLLSKHSLQQLATKLRCRRCARGGNTSSPCLQISALQLVRQ